MTEWSHKLNQVEYELVIDSILRASAIATVMEETADDLDADAVKQMAGVMRERLLEALVLGQFNEADVKAINARVMASMLPDAHH